MKALFLGEMNELVTFFRVQEVCEALTPAIFEFYKDFDQLDVVLELRIDYFDVLVVLAQQRPKRGRVAAEVFGETVRLLF